MLCTGAFQDDADASRRSYLELTHLVVRRALGQMLKNPAVGEALAAVVPAPTQQQQEREKAANEHWESNTLFETDAELQRQREEEEERLRLQREEEVRTSFYFRMGNRTDVVFCFNSYRMPFEKRR